MTGWLRQFALAFRSFRRTPGVPLVAIAMLAIGIGANTAMFSVVDAVLLKPLPFPAPDRLVRIWATAPERGLDLAEVSHQRFLDLAAENRTLARLGAFVLDWVDLTGTGDPLRLRAARISEGFLDALGVRPATGRGFVAAEEAPGGPGAVLLGNRIWRARFGGDARVVGRSIDIDGASHTVVGVLPATFRFPSDDVDVWIPRIDAPSFLNRGNVERGSTYLDLVGRVRPGIAPGRLQADLDRLAAGDRRTGFLDEGLRYRFVPLSDDIARSARPMLLILFGAVGLVLAIACVDVTGLLLVRAIERRREIAVRKALGATRGSLVRQLLAESVLIAAAAAVLGVLLARAALPALVTLAARYVPRASEVRLDLRVLAATSFAALATGVAFGLAPALRGARTDIRASLAESGRTAVGRRGRGRDLLIALEVALAVVLLMGAGLVLRTILRLESVDPGFRPDHVVVARIDLPASRYASREAIRGLFSRFHDALDGLPGVGAVGAAEAMPLSSGSQQTLVAVEGTPLPPLGERPIVSFDTVGFDYFRALGIPLLAGRTFRDADGPDAPLRIVVNRRFASRFFAGRNAVGGRVFIGRSPSPVEIVGVVGDVRNEGLDAGPREAFYLSALQHPVASMTFAVRATRSAGFLAPILRDRLRTLDPDLPLAELSTMEDVVADSIGSRRLIAILLGIFAGVALLLAAVGLFSVLSYAVRQRAPEIGIRIALGAPPRRILAETVGAGARVVSLGLALGLGASTLLARFIATLLYETRPVDPVTIAGTVALLAATALAASWLPARRASRVDPMTTLRTS